MAVMDEFKEEREALKNGTPRQKLAYFWYYYKWHVIIALVVIIMIVSFIKQLTDRKDPLFLCRDAECQPLRSDDLGTAGFCYGFCRKRGH